MYRDHSISYALVCKKVLSHKPMQTRSSGPYVSSLSEKSIPNCYTHVRQALEVNVGWNLLGMLYVLFYVITEWLY